MIKTGHAYFLNFGTDIHVMVTVKDVRDGHVVYSLVDDPGVESSLSESAFRIYAEL